MQDTWTAGVWCCCFRFHPDLSARFARILSVRQQSEGTGWDTGNFIWRGKGSSTIWKPSGSATYTVRARHFDRSGNSSSTTATTSVVFTDPALTPVVFGGTIDAPSVDKQGRIVLLDWKTSNGIYLSQKLQLAAYERLWNENRPEQIVQRRAVVRIGKDRADDHSIEWMFSSQPEWEYFKARLDLYYAGLRYKTAA